MPWVCWPIEGCVPDLWANQSCALAGYYFHPVGYCTYSWKNTAAMWLLRSLEEFHIPQPRHRSAFDQRRLSAIYSPDSFHPCNCRWSQSITLKLLEILLVVNNIFVQIRYAKLNTATGSLQPTCGLNCSNPLWKWFLLLGSAIFSWQRKFHLLAGLLRMVIICAISKAQFGT